MSNKNITLIDADFLCYIGGKDDTLSDILEKVDYKIDSILKETGADFYVLFTSKGKYFRHNLKDKQEDKGSYKANRTYKGQEYSKTIKEYLIAKYDAQYKLMSEADDLVAYWIVRNLYLNELPNKYIIDNFVPESKEVIKSTLCNNILVSCDKDLLQSISGKHLNPNKKVAPDTWDMVWIETSMEDSELFVKSQIIIGDASDGVPGLYRKGEAFWRKLIAESTPRWGDILNLYINDFGDAQGIYEFQKNYRLLHLLRTDVDWLREVGSLPTLPRFNEVLKENEDTNPLF